MTRPLQARVATGKASDPAKTQEQNQGHEALSQIHPIRKYKQTSPFAIKMRMKLSLKTVPNLMALDRRGRERIVCIVVGPEGAAASKTAVARRTVVRLRNE